MFMYDEESELNYDIKSEFLCWDVIVLTCIYYIMWVSLDNGHVMDVYSLET